MTDVDMHNDPFAGYEDETCSVITAASAQYGVRLQEVGPW